VFTIWEYALIGVGVMITGKITGGRAVLTAVILWTIVTLPSLVGAIVGGSIAAR
jgi:hypothetical protein